MSFWNTLGGATRYEFMMQIRRPSLWIGLGLIAVLLQAAFASFTAPPTGISPSQEDTLILWTAGCNFLLIVGAGLLLADRTPRDGKTKVIELLRTSPAPTLGRILGKYSGAVLATLVPIIVIYATGVARLMVQWGPDSFAPMLPLALATFAALVVPAVLFVGAFSIACTSVLWTPLYQFLFVGYWLWTQLNPGDPLPTLNRTLLTPTLRFVINGFFSMHDYFPVDKGFYPDSSVALGIANIAILLACAAAALMGGWLVLRWRASAE